MNINYNLNQLMHDLSDIKELIIAEMPKIDAYLIILKGGAIFIPTLLRIMPPAPIFTTHLSSYNSEHKSGLLQVITPIPLNYILQNKCMENIVVLDDVYDTGQTMRYIKRELEMAEKLNYIPCFFKKILCFCLFQKRRDEFPIVCLYDISSQMREDKDLWLKFEWDGGKD